MISLQVADAEAIKVRIQSYTTNYISYDSLTSLSFYKEITSHRTRFVKAVEEYTILEFFGPNVVVSEHDQWKRYRKVSAPAFSEVKCIMPPVQSRRVFADGATSSGTIGLYGMRQ